MAVKKQFNINWMAILAVFLVILITLVVFLIYIVMKKDTVKPATNVVQERIVYVNKEQPETQKQDIPVYPKELPSYNNKDYQQIGILSANETDKEPIVLPIFARKLQNHSDRWQYYTATDKNNMIRLPVKHENKNCEDDLGCREIYDGDTINIDTYRDRVFTVTIYKKNVPQYFADRY